jgi:hypothetical protein
VILKIKNKKERRRINAKEYVARISVEFDYKISE